MSQNISDISPPLGPCKWYISIQQPECGEEGVAKVKVRDRGTQAMVVLCTEHKAKHDETFARIRAAHKAS